MAIVITVWQPGYAANDDAFLASIPSGSFSGQPDGRMVFTGPIIGFPLAGLYSLWPDVPFYMYMEYLALALSLAAAIVVATILSRRALVPVALGVIFLWFALFSQWLLNIMFTPIALALTSVGLLIVLLALAQPRINIWVLVTAGLFFAVGGFLRDDVSPRPNISLSVFVVLLPFFLLLAYNLRIKRALIFFVSFLIGLAVNFVARQFIYTGSLWQSALTAESQRSAILDSPAISASVLFAERAGLTQNDYSLFYQNGYLDRTVFSPETMQRLVDVTAGATASGQGFFYQPSLMWANFLDYSAPARSLLLIGVAFVFISLLNLNSLRQRIIFLSVTFINLAWFAGILYYLGESRKVAAHVQLPIAYIFLLLILVAPLAFLKTSRVRPAESWQAKLSRTGLAIVPALVVYFSFGNPLAILGIQSQANIARQASAERLISDLRTLDANAAYISICCTVPWESADPTKARPFDEWPVQIVGGWPPFTPMWERRNELLGISEGVPKDPYGTTDLVEALISNPRVRLIATEQAAGALAAQMAQYRKWQGCMTPLTRLSNNAVVYQATPQAEC